MLDQSLQVELKLNALANDLNDLTGRLEFVGRESVVLPHLHDILQLLSSCLEKVNNEACRIGIVKKRARLPEVKGTTLRC